MLETFFGLRARGEGCRIRWLGRELEPLVESRAREDCVMAAREESRGRVASGLEGRGDS